MKEAFGLYVPIVLPQGINGPAVIVDECGEPIEVTIGALTIVETKLCVTAEWLRGQGDTHVVQFEDGQIATVRFAPKWEYTPPGYVSPKSLAA